MEQGGLIMPKICINGIVRDMTEEEVKEFEALAEEIPGTPTREELEDRVASLEATLNLLISQIRK
jgi:hypothetical protein